jgi:glycogen operon protein
MITMSCAAARGVSAPLGATVRPDGVNFSIFSRNATRLELLLFDDGQAPEPAQIVDLDPAVHRTHDYWHVFVPGLRAGQVYAYRAHGPFVPERGWRFDHQKVLIDPYGLAVTVPASYNRDAAREPGGNAASAMKSVVADPNCYDWEGDRPLRRPLAESVMYELHVRGFTRHESSGVHWTRRGTYAGLIDKIPYLQALGITAVQLLPVFQFDPCDAAAGRVNYWGYQPVSFFAPHDAYSSQRTPLGVLDEFRDMVKALHRAGLEVILDVIFNHTTEGGPDGPTLCFRGLGNDIYYGLGTDGWSGADAARGGNTLNVHHPIVRRLIQDSLRYWVTDMHVDGFRVDVASLPSRDEADRRLPTPRGLREIESDPALAGTKLISGWNGRFRDDVRKFVRGDDHSVAALATCLLGSPAPCSHERETEPINFVTCHDGFTLNDLVSYNHKHNEDNGEGNGDGAADNLSWNCGVEGPSDDPAVETLRNRQAKNLLALELLAVGTPMLLMGDEVRRTQRGNNNPYCQDNEISWFDWTGRARHWDVFRFVSTLNAIRLRRDLGAGGRPLSLHQLLRGARVSWHGIELERPDWSARSRALAFTLRSRHARVLFHAMFNTGCQPLEFQLPPLRPRSEFAWRRCLDTALAPPDDIQPWTEAPAVGDQRYLVQPRSVVLLALELRRAPGSRGGGNAAESA